MAKIVIIDDESDILDLMTQICRSSGHQVRSFTTGTEAVASIRAEPPDLALVDLHIGDINGLELIKMARAEFPDTAVIMVTGHGSVETAVEAMRLGAFDYITKPFDVGDLSSTVEHALRRKGGASVAPVSGPVVSRRAEGVKLIGFSAAIRRILDIVRRVADSASPVLLEGEFGTGKQMVARVLHTSGGRAAAPFKELQCSALPEADLETELFGHDGNAATGIFGRANGGTVHLAEVHQLPIRIQAQLNTFLEDHIGSRSPWGTGGQISDFRLVTSTTVSLEDAIREGRFREDLFYRISVVPVKIPPLRERREDVEPLVGHFLREISERSGMPLKQIRREALDFLCGYAWPGNISELRNAVERACALSTGDIEPSDLPSKVCQELEIPQAGDAAPQRLPIGITLDEFVRGLERQFIQETLKYNSGSREKTASMLGVSIATLYRKLDLGSERKTTA
jgi:DNA-binding NtrC family response regulator